MSKTKSLIAHSAERAQERYGIILNGELRNSITLQVKTRRGKFLADVSARCSAWDVKVQNQICRIIYDHTRHSIVTFLPPNGTYQWVD